MTVQKLKPYSYFVRLYDLNLRNTTDYARGESSHRRPALWLVLASNSEVYSLAFDLRISSISATVAMVLR